MGEANERMSMGASDPVGIRMPQIGGEAHYPEMMMSDILAGGAPY